MKVAFNAIWMTILATLLSFCYANNILLSDTFTGSNSTWATTGVIGTTTLSAARSGDDWGSRLYNNRLEMYNDISIATNANGWVFAHNSIPLPSPYTTRLKSNPGYVTWSFNLRSPRIDPEGFAVGNFGIAYILAGSSTSVFNAGSGYAVVLGQSGTTDSIRLVKYSGGLSTSLTNIIVSSTPNLADLSIEYLSIAVKYDPSAQKWELFLRNDGSAGFVDPRTGSLTTQGTAIDSTYTDVALDKTGCYWQGFTTAQVAYFDNIRITETLEPVSQPTNLTFSIVHSTAFEVSYTAAGGTPDGYLAIRKTGSAPTGVPVDGITYTAGAALGDGTVVYSGSAVAFSQTGLSPGTAYYYKIFAYSGTGISINYKTGSPLAGSQTTTTTLIMWLDANALGLSDGTAVGNWTDASGNGRNAVQDTLALKPIFRTNIINGKPAVVFDGGNDYLAFDGNVAVNTNYTIFAVVRRAAGDNSIRAILGGTNPALNKNMHLGWRSNGILTHAQYSNDYDMKVNSYTAGETPFIIAFRHSTTLGNDSYVNGSLRGLNMNTAVSGRLANLAEWQGAALGRYFGGATLNTRFNGWIAEIKVYDEYLSDSERKAVESTLSTKYNIAVTNTASPEHYTNLVELSIPAANTGSFFAMIPKTTIPS